MKTEQTHPAQPVANDALFGFAVVLSLSEMVTLTRAMEAKTQNARWFAANNLFGSRDKALADCDRAEKRIAELKAMEPRHHEPNDLTLPPNGAKNDAENTQN